MLKFVSENMDYDTRLINEVKRYAELYDNTHKDFKNKEVKLAIWSDITYKLKKECDEQSVKSVRNRWKSLRDSYVKETKHKMALSTGENVKPRKNWRYSEAMSFLAPYLAISFPRRSQTEYELDDKDENPVEQPMETYFVNLDTFQDSSNEGHFMGALLDYPENSTASPMEEQHENDIDSFFRGVADTVKKLRPANQVKIQKDIVNMVLDIKLKEIESNNNNS